MTLYVQTLQEDLTGAAFHPLDDNLLITHGKGHLTFWTRRKDGFFERTDIIKPVSFGSGSVLDGFLVEFGCEGVNSVWTLSNQRFDTLIYYLFHN